MTHRRVAKGTGLCHTKRSHHYFGNAKSLTTEPYGFLTEGEIWAIKKRHEEEDGLD